MSLSSAYVAPLDLDLRPGRIEAGLRLLVLAIGLGVIFLADFSWALRAALASFAVVWVLHDRRRAQARPLALRLHAEGEAQLRRVSLDDWQACTLLQASWYLGWPVLGIRDAAGKAHHCALLPDRADAATRQRLRVWLQTHAPGAQEDKAA